MSTAKLFDDAWRHFPGLVQYLLDSWREDCDANPATYRLIDKDGDAAVRQLEAQGALEQLSDEGYSIRFTLAELIERRIMPIPYKKAIVGGFDLFCQEERERVRSSALSDLLALIAKDITDWDPLECGRMEWAIFRHPNPTYRPLADFLALYHDEPKPGIADFLHELAALPQRAVEDATRKLRRQLTTAECRIAALEARSTALRKRPTEEIVPAAQPPPSGASETVEELRRRNSRLEDTLREKGKQVVGDRRTIAELREEVGRYREATAAPKAVTPPPSPLTFADYRLLSDSYRGRKVLAFGGFRGEAPVGTTRNYHDFLRELGAQLEIISTDVRAPAVGEKLQRAAPGTVVLYLTYCAGHDFDKQIRRYEPPLLIKLGSTTYDEAAFIRALLQPFKKSNGSGNSPR